MAEARGGGVPPGLLEKAAAAIERAAPARPEPAVAIPDETQAARARELAAKASTLEELRSILAEFDGCNLRLTAKNLVFADGNPQADLMLGGRSAGAGRGSGGAGPSSGGPGGFSTASLAAIGRDRLSAYITNVIPWRPPGNRDPSPIETEICRPFIERQIELVAPKVLVTARQSVHQAAAVSPARASCARAASGRSTSTGLFFRVARSTPCPPCTRPIS